MGQLIAIAFVYIFILGPIVYYIIEPIVKSIDTFLENKKLKTVQMIFYFVYYFLFLWLFLAGIFYGEISKGIKEIMDSK